MQWQEDNAVLIYFQGKAFRRACDTEEHEKQGTELLIHTNLLVTDKFSG